MSKRTRGTTADANKRRESHARKVWGRTTLPKAHRWIEEVTSGKRVDRSDELKRRRRRVLGRNLVLHIDGQKIRPVSAAALDWRDEPGVH